MHHQKDGEQNNDFCGDATVWKLVSWFGFFNPKPRFQFSKKKNCFGAFLGSYNEKPKTGKKKRFRSYHQITIGTKIK